MKKIILRNGLYITLIIVGIPLVVFLWEGPMKMESTGMAEIIGYGSIVLSLGIFIFLGVRQFRNEINDGKLSFGEALKIGLLIAMIPAVAFGLYNYVYTEWMDPGFMDNYYSHQVAQLQDTLSPQEFEVRVEAMEAEKEMFMNPFMQFFVMFVTVLIIGLIVSVLTSFVLKSSPNTQKNL